MKYADIDVAEQFRDDWDRFDLWSLTSTVKDSELRAYSIANYPEERGVIMLNVRISTPPPGADDAAPGKMSSYIFSLKPGDTVTISGPFGEFFAKDTDAEMVFIGGGAGMAPMRSHVFDQLRRLHSTRKMSFWYGARSRREMFYVEDFDMLAREHDQLDGVLRAHRRTLQLHQLRGTLRRAGAQRQAEANRRNRRAEYSHVPRPGLRAF